MSAVTLFAIAEVVWIVGLAVWIVLERRSPIATVAWLLVLAVLPYVGIPIYLLVGPRRLTRKRRHASARSRIRQTSAARRSSQGEPAPLLTENGKLRQFMHLVERAGEGPPLRCERLKLLTTGDGCYAEIEQAIEAAQHHVHLEYYIWEPDVIGTRWRNLLCAKARHGVQVRLLVDAIGSSGLKRRFLAPLREAGVEVAWFNPLTLARFRPGLINFRTHRKIVVCDGRVGFTGGINVCCEHSVQTMAAAAWRDTHVMIEEAPVGWLQTVFLEDWEFATDLAPSAPAYFPDPERPATGPWVQILASGPDHDVYAIHQFYFAVIAEARERVLISTPYFVPDEAICTALMNAALRGVEVRLLVPRRGDSRLVSAAARTYYADLARFGVRVYEYGPAMLHAKTMVIDGEIAVVGTANMDNRSFRLNFEIIAAIYDRQVAEEMAQIFDADLQFAELYRPDRARRVPQLQRLAESGARLFSPLL